MGLISLLVKVVIEEAHLGLLNVMNKEGDDHILLYFGPGGYQVALGVIYTDMGGAFEAF